MKERVEKPGAALPRVGSEARVLLLGALVAHIGLYGAAAVGTVFATLDGLSRWVAVTVGFHHVVSSWLQTFRIDERRAACHRAVAALEGARVEWMSLPQELQARQGEVDKVVAAVERALEATLPPPPAHGRATEADDIDFQKISCVCSYTPTVSLAVGSSFLVSAPPAA